MKRIAIGIANLDGKKPAVHLHRRAGANFRWIPWILKFIENWYSKISKFAGNAKSAICAKNRNGSRRIGGDSPGNLVNFGFPSNSAFSRSLELRVLESLKFRVLRHLNLSKLIRLWYHIDIKIKKQFCFEVKVVR